jgi:hypothetical protein
VQGPAGSLRGVLDHDRACLSREALHLYEVDGAPVQVHNDDRRYSLTQDRLQVREIRGEGMGIHVVQEDSHIRTIRRCSQIVARIRGHRDRGAGSVAEGAEERRRQRCGRFRSAARPSGSSTLAGV